MLDNVRPTIHAIGIPHQIPSVPIVFDKVTEIGILIAHDDKSEKNMGMNVSPAPLSVPVKINISIKAR